MTDANLLLGRLPAGEELPGGLRLDRAAAEAAIARLAAELELDTLRTAEGILRLADQEMAGAVRRMTVERGLDPRDFALLPFGGAGPMHVAGIAELMGIGRILCPRAGGVLSALGLAASDRRRDAAQTVLLSGPELTADRLAMTVERLADELETGPRDRLEVICAMRYRGQAFELDVATRRRPDPQTLARDFARLHEERYGFADRDGEVELVTVRVAAIEPGPAVALEASAGDPVELGERPVCFDGVWHEAVILRGDPEPGRELVGPAVAEMSGSTLVLPPGWRAATGPDGTLTAERLSEARP